MHHLQEIEGMSLRAAEYCVFDEADRLFEMGFSEQLRAILAKLGPSRQTLLFSATLPAALAEFARAGLRSPEFVRLDADSKLSPDLALAFFSLRCSHCDSGRRTLYGNPSAHSTTRCRGDQLQPSFSRQYSLFQSKSSRCKELCPTKSPL